MKIHIILSVIVLSLSVLVNQALAQSSPDEPRYLGSIEVFDDELHSIMNTDASPVVIGEGFRFTEGPVWVKDGEFLLFSDIPANTIYRWSKAEGISIYLHPAGYTGDSGRGGGLGPNGLILNHEGSLVIAQHGDRRIARMDAPLSEPVAKFITLAGMFDGKKLHSPNDVIQHSDGSYYFTDPPYGLNNDSDREMETHGVYRVDAGGVVTLLADDFTRPNGLAFSPDEKQLYIGNSDPQKAYWMIYDVAENGGIANGRVFHDITGKVGSAPGLPDGLKVSRSGHLFATGPGGVWIFAPDGRALGRIHTGVFTSNCAFDEQEQHLYMTAGSLVLRLGLNTD